MKQVSTTPQSCYLVAPNGDEYVVGSDVLCKAWASGSGNTYAKIELVITGPGGFSNTSSQTTFVTGNWSTEYGNIITTNNVAGQYTVTAKLYSGTSLIGPFTLLDTHVHYFYTYQSGGGG